MQKILLFIVVWVLLVPAVGMGGDGDRGPGLQTNADIIADETASMILALFDEERILRAINGSVIEQPLFLQLNAPASVREKITSLLMQGGVRIAGEPDGYHTLRIEWEADNSLFRGNDIQNRRTIRMDMVFTWLDPAREIQITWKDSFVREDWVTSDQVEVVASSWNPAAFHRRESSRRYSVIRRIAEPALITGVVAVTIYLLYNVRR